MKCRRQKTIAEQTRSFHSKSIAISSGTFLLAFLIFYYFQIDFGLSSIIWLILGSSGLAFIATRPMALAWGRTLERELSNNKSSPDPLAQRENVHKIAIADVATGVLHSIGNVLHAITSNSNELQTLLAENHLLPKLTKLNKTFQEQDRNLCNYLQQGDKLKLLLQFTDQLHQAFQSEFKEMAKLNAHVHKASYTIAEIIRDQQSLANPTMNREMVAPLETLQRAIEIKTPLLKQCQVHIECRCPALDHVFAHRARIFQVFINLISNACQALMERPDDRKILITCEHEGKFLSLLFHDNGPGISSDVQPKLFTYGFTTKTNGHGFGLHSCKRFMTEIDGDIAYEPSELCGGACFRVKLPLKSV